MDSRKGLIETAAGGVLFLDEVHNFPVRVQRSLLRLIEDGKFSRIGEAEQKKISVRFIFASNAPEPDYGLAPDLLHRLRVVRVPPLRERVADIPSIFNHLLRRTAESYTMEAAPLMQLLTAEHYETLCLNKFVDSNVRGLVDLADTLVTTVVSGVSLQDAVNTVFANRFGPQRQETVDDIGGHTQSEESATSHYERHKAVIMEAFARCNGNLTATDRFLRERGIACNRRWLTIHLDRWGVERRRKPSRKK